MEIGSLPEENNGYEISKARFIDKITNNSSYFYTKKELDTVISGAIKNHDLTMIELLLTYYYLYDRTKFIFKIIHEGTPEFFKKLQRNYFDVHYLKPLMNYSEVGWTDIQEELFLKTIEFNENRSFHYFLCMRPKVVFNSKKILNAIVQSITHEESSFKEAFKLACLCMGEDKIDFECFADIIEEKFEMFDNRCPFYLHGLMDFFMTQETYEQFKTTNGNTMIHLITKFRCLDVFVHDYIDFLMLE